MLPRNQEGNYACVPQILRLHSETSVLEQETPPQWEPTHHNKSRPSPYTEKAVATQSSTPAWKIPWMEEPGRLQSMGCWGSDRTEQLHFHFSLLRIGEGNGNPLHCSCLENPMDGGAWWTAIYGVAQSRTRLKWLNSSSRSSLLLRTSLFSASRGSSVIAVHWLFNHISLDVHHRLEGIQAQ